MLVKTTMKFNMFKWFNGFKLLKHTKLIKPLKHPFMSPVCNRCIPDSILVVEIFCKPMVETVGFLILYTCCDGLN
jgi:hypothetical protein